MQQLVETSVSVDALLQRYKKASTLEGPIDKDRIKDTIRRWAIEFGISSLDTPIRFIDTEAALYEIIGEATPSDVWSALKTAEEVLDTPVAKAALAIRHARAGEAMRAARFAGLSWEVLMAIGASPIVHEATLQRWLPLLEALEAGCFSFWIGKDEIYATIVPTKIALDEKLRLHCDSGPAFTWLSDFHRFYWHGVHVPQYVIERPQDIHVNAINLEKNVELRRAMIERYKEGQEINGATAYMMDAGGKRIDYDEKFGTLWRCETSESRWEPHFVLGSHDDSENCAQDHRYDIPLVMLEVVNSTPEPDGRFKRYFLRVPPEMTKARDAAAWTFNLSAKEYAPLIET